VALLCACFIQGISSIPLNYPGDCASRQSLEAGNIYKYKYLSQATTFSSDELHVNSKFQIYCDLSIFVYASCSARMSLDSCKVSENIPTDREDNFAVVAGKRGKELSQQLSKSDMIFHFDEAEVKEVFYSPDELSSTTNIKKSIISQLVFNLVNVNEKPFMIVASSPQGGTTERIIVSSALDAYILTKRSQNHVPESTSLRLPGVGFSPFADLITPFLNMVSGQSSVEAGAKDVNERCEYKLVKNRILDTMTCEETYNIVAMRGNTNILKQSTSTSLVLKSNESGTKKQLSRGNRNAKKKFVRDSIQFDMESLKDEKSEIMEDKFNPVKTMVKMSTGSTDEATPLIGRMEKWMVTRSDENEISDVWRSVKKTVKRNFLAKAKQLWTSLLLSCVDNKWCQNTAECNKRRACQVNLITQLGHTDDERDLVQLYTAISNMNHPSSVITDYLLATVSENKNSEYFAAVARTSKNIKQSDLVSQAASDSVDSLNDHVMVELERLCRKRRFDESDLTSLEGAISSVALMVPDNKDRVLRMLNDCWTNNQLSPIEGNNVMLALVKATATTELIQLQEERRRLLSMLNQDVSSQVKLSSFLALITNNPTRRELNRFTSMVLRGSTGDAAVCTFMENFMKTQMSLVATNKSLLSASTVETLQQAYSVKMLKREDYTYPVPISMTGMTLNISFSVIREDTWSLPKLIEVNLSVPEKGMDILHFECQFASLAPYMDNLFGPDGVFPLDSMSAFKIRTMTSWIRSWFADEPALSRATKHRINGIRNELNFLNLVNDISSSTFFSLQVMGQNIDMNSLTSGGVQLTPGQIFSLLEQVEQGFESRQLFTSSPITYRNSFFTLIGVPLVSTVEISAMFEMEIDALVDISKFFFTGYSNSFIKMNPR